MVPFFVWEAEICVGNLDGDSGPSVIADVGEYAEKMRRIVVEECH